MRVTLSPQGRTVFWCITAVALVLEGGVLAWRWQTRPSQPMAEARPVELPLTEPVASPPRAAEIPAAPIVRPPVPVADPSPAIPAARTATTPEPSQGSGYSRGADLRPAVECPNVDKPRPAHPSAVPSPAALPSPAVLASPVRPVRPKAPIATVAPPDDAVEYGQELFLREWTPRLAGLGEPDGLGPLYNDTSCVGCHSLGRAGGGGPKTKNVLLRTSGTDSRMIHHFGTSREHSLWRAVMLGQTAGNRTPLDQAQRFSLTPGTGSGTTRIVERNSTALFGAGLIDAIPDEVLLEAERTSKKLSPVSPGFEAARAMGRPTSSAPRSGRLARLQGGKLGRFGWKGQTATLDDFARAACAIELGLSAPGQRQPTPAYEKPLPPLSPEPVNDLSNADCDALVTYLKSLPQPRQRLPRNTSERAGIERGESRFAQIGCTDCHRPTLGSAEGIYSDLLLHDMGPGLSDDGFTYYVPPETPGKPPDPALVLATAREWRTPPLWGVRDSAPYLHDGRAETLEKAIALHGGEGWHSARDFFALDEDSRLEVLSFLKSLTAPD